MLSKIRGIGSPPADRLKEKFGTQAFSSWSFAASCAQFSALPAMRTEDGEFLNIYQKLALRANQKKGDSPATSTALTVRDYPLSLAPSRRRLED